MTDRPDKRHGLEPFTAGLRKAKKAALEIRIRGDLGHLNLRGKTGDGHFVETCEQLLGQPLPLEPNTFSAADGRVYWLGPDEWLVVAEAGRIDALAAELTAALENSHAAVNNLSGGQVALRLTGEPCRDLLAKGCTLDLHPRVFSAGCCAQSGLARANVLIGCLEDDGFELVVRRSFADYLLRWLQHAGADRGIRFREP
jgi:sarcosine oxidase subunit gamma